MNATLDELTRVTRRMKEREAKQAADLKVRDQLVLTARAEGEQPTAIARAASVTRGRVHQILDAAKAA